MAEPAGVYAEGPEALVVSLAMRGDKAAFAELVRRRQPWLRNLMRRLSGNEEQADDLAQQVLLQAWRKIRNLREPGAFGGWLKKIAINTWLDQQRKNGDEWTREYDDNRHAALPASTVAAIDLDAALAVLPPPVRGCIVLSYREQLSHGEIAELLSLPIGTVKSHIRRGSARLRELLDGYGVSK